MQYAILFSENKRRAEMREHSITTEMLFDAVLFLFSPHPTKAHRKVRPLLPDIVTKQQQINHAAANDTAVSRRKG